ncbi:MAG: aldehyde dehydrogenase [Bacteroidetes bacterium]|nr:aldehyde dehydrogenase [Bacteroidota bacterium]
MIQLQNYINGSFEPPKSGAYLENFEPAKGEVFSMVPNSGPEDVEAAYQAAWAAFPAWKNTPAEEKFKILNRIAELIDSNRNRFAEAESRDQGKPVWLAKNEMVRAAQNFRFFATAAMQFASESHSMEDRGINYTLRQPLGVVGCISPWNLPLYLYTWKIAPALAAGNCVVSKPSEFTPYSAYILGEICTEAGLPAGVLNIVHGLGNSAGQAIVEHPGIKAISFTGGTVTGKHIASVAAPMFKKLSLELGGKNPNIIFADADLEKAVKTTINSSFLNQGEICLCGSRILIQKQVYETVKNKLVDAVNQMKTGNPADEKTRIGAIVSKPHYHKVLGYIDLAKEEGGNILTGGKALDPEGFENGWFIAPTIIEGLPYDCRTNQEEIFGPVVSLIPFETEEEALQMANSTNYGLACSIWTSDLNRAHKMAAAIESGIVWINCWLLRDLRTPFGGVKQSGVGREGGWEAMRFFTDPKNVCIAF